MFCHKCGSQSLDEAVFCQQCGAELIVDEMPSESIVVPEPVVEPESVFIPEPVVISAPVIVVETAAVQPIPAQEETLQTDIHSAESKQPETTSSTVAVIDENTKYDVVLTYAGEDILATTKMVYEWAGVGMDEVQYLVYNLPKTLKKDLAKDAAERFKEALAKVGARVELEPVFEQEAMSKAEPTYKTTPLPISVPKTPLSKAEMNKILLSERLCKGLSILRFIDAVVWLCFMAFAGAGGFWNLISVGATIAVGVRLWVAASDSDSDKMGQNVGLSLSWSVLGFFWYGFLLFVFEADSLLILAISIEAVCLIVAIAVLFTDKYTRQSAFSNPDRTDRQIRTGHWVCIILGAILSVIIGSLMLAFPVDFSVDFYSDMLVIVVCTLVASLVMFFMGIILKMWHNGSKSAQQKKKIWIVAIIAVVVIATAAILPFASQNSEYANSYSGSYDSYSSSSSSNSYSSTKTHTDSREGFSFEYPNGWEFNYDFDFLVSISKSDNSAFICIDKYDIGYGILSYTKADFEEFYAGLDAFRIIDLSTVYVDGCFTKKLNFSYTENEGFPSRGIAYYYNSGDYTYEVIFFSDEDYMIFNESYFNDIMNSYRITR